jgi:hypothetical protein
LFRAFRKIIGISPKTYRKKQATKTRTPASERGADVSGPNSSRVHIEQPPPFGHAPTPRKSKFL